MLIRILKLTTITIFFLAIVIANILHSCQDSGRQHDVEFKTLHILRDGEVVLDSTQVDSLEVALDSTQVDTLEVLVPIVFMKQHSN